MADKRNHATASRTISTSENANQIAQAPTDAAGNQGKDPVAAIFGCRCGATTADWTSRCGISLDLAAMGASAIAAGGPSDSAISSVDAESWGSGGTLTYGTAGREGRINDVLGTTAVSIAPFIAAGFDRSDLGNETASDQCVNPLTEAMDVSSGQISTAHNAVTWTTDCTADPCRASHREIAKPARIKAVDCTNQFNAKLAPACEAFVIVDCQKIQDMQCSSRGEGLSLT